MKTSRNTNNPPSDRRKRTAGGCPSKTRRSDQYSLDGKHSAAVMKCVFLSLIHSLAL